MGIADGNATSAPEIKRVSAVPEGAAMTELAGLSVFFPAFVPHFVRQTLGVEGEVWVARSGGVVTGLLLVEPGERTGSVFARSDDAARALLLGRGALEVYAEQALVDAPERFGVFRVDLPDEMRTHRFVHAVRLASPRDREALLRLLTETFGGVDERWFRPLPPAPERGFVAQAEGEVVGAAWVAVVGATARFHSLSVRPRYRGLGVGHDLWQARALWASGQGARSAVTEIADRNGPSRAIARAGGMVEVGSMYRFRTEGAPTGAPDP